MKRLLLFICIVTYFQEVYSEKIYVFVPSTSSPKAIKKKLSGKVSGDILTFSKMKDFVKKVKSDKPSAVITRSAVLQKIPGYTTKLNGLFKGKKEQMFYAVNTSGSFTASAKSKVGIVDFFGGKKMSSIANKVVGTKTKVKKVKKFKDLLPLLTMNMVDVILVAESELKVLKKSSSQDLKHSKMPNPVKGFVVFATSGTTACEAELLKLSKTENLSMGVESWEK